MICTTFLCACIFHFDERNANIASNTCSGIMPVLQYRCIVIIYNYSNNHLKTNIDIYSDKKVCINIYMTIVIHIAEQRQ